MSHTHYTQLKRKERDFIEISLRNGHSIRFIALELERSPSTISREIARNSKPNKNRVCRVNKTPLCKLDARKYRGSELASEIVRAKAELKLRQWYFEKRRKKYLAGSAEYKARRRSIMGGKKANPLLLESPEYGKTLTFIREGLRKRWSPEQISLRIRYLNEHHLASYRCVSPNTIYRYIYAVKDEELTKCLRRRGIKYCRPHQKTLYNITNRAGHSIHERPKVVDDLRRAGDLEGDTIFGADKKDRLLTHTDRRTGLTSISLVKSFNAYKISKQTVKDVERVFGGAYTITYDNGVEFSFWKDTEQATRASIYFADPYTPSQRGRNENANGLIRDFLPKGTDFKKLAEADIMKIEFLINNRPRKRLGGRTPYEAYVALRAEM